MSHRDCHTSTGATPLAASATGTRSAALLSQRALTSVMLLLVTSRTCVTQHHAIFKCLLSCRHFESSRGGASDSCSLKDSVCDSMACWPRACHLRYSTSWCVCGYFRQSWPSPCCPTIRVILLYNSSTRLESFSFARRSGGSLCAKVLVWTTGFCAARRVTMVTVATVPCIGVVVSCTCARGPQLQHIYAAAVVDQAPPTGHQPDQLCTHQTLTHVVDTRVNLKRYLTRYSSRELVKQLPNMNCPTRHAIIIMTARAMPNGVCKYSGRFGTVATAAAPNQQPASLIKNAPP